MGIKKRQGQADFSEASRVIDNNAEKYVQAVVSMGAVNARKLAPVEYSTLVNSMFTAVVYTGARYRGRVGFGVSYAKYLNGVPGKPTPKWSPRPASEKDGPADNMNAEPGFLDKAFESPEAQSEIDSLKRIFSI